MRYLLPAIVALIVLAMPAHSRLTILPTDDIGGGGSGNIPWFMHFGSNSSAWPTTVACLSVTGGGSSHRGCDPTSAPDSRSVKTYFGTPTVRYMACAPAEDHTSWGSSASLSVAVFSVQGSNVETNYVRTQIGGALSFDETDGAGVSKRLTINSPVPISNAQIQVKFTAVGSAPSVPVDNGLVCVVALSE